MAECKDVRFTEVRGTRLRGLIQSCYNRELRSEFLLVDMAQMSNGDWILKWNKMSPVLENVRLGAWEAWAKLREMMSKEPTIGKYVLEAMDRLLPEES